MKAAPYLPAFTAPTRHTNAAEALAQVQLIYSQQIALNSFAPAGDYTIWISSLDKLGNKVFYPTDIKFNVSE